VRRGERGRGFADKKGVENDEKSEGSEGSEDRRAVDIFDVLE
jgi:hypothetical protein